MARKGRSLAWLGKEEVRMKKQLMTALLACTLLLMASVPAYADPPTEVSGDLVYWFEWVPGGMREAGPNIFMDGTEHEHWQGGLVGTGDSEFTVGMFAAGFWNVWLRCEFSGTVDGKQGTLQLQLVGKKPPNEDWYGQWVILGGTGELANAHGQGIWWGPGYRSDQKVDGDPDVSYSGQIHFDP
jgi:Protein of unknown function (DUF3224)